MLVGSTYSLSKAKDTALIVKLYYRVLSFLQ